MCCFGLSHPACICLCCFGLSHPASVFFGLTHPACICLCCFGLSHPASVFFICVIEDSTLYGLSSLWPLGLFCRSLGISFFFPLLSFFFFSHRQVILSWPSSGPLLWIHLPIPFFKVWCFIWHFHLLFIRGRVATGSWINPRVDPDQQELGVSSFENVFGPLEGSRQV